jgi:hypothetical protein
VENISRRKTQKDWNLENIDFVLFFTVDSAMSHVGKSQRNGATACARPLQKRTENASGRTMKIMKKCRKSVKKRWKNRGRKQSRLQTPKFIDFSRFWGPPGEAKSMNFRKKAF